MRKKFIDVMLVAAMAAGLVGCGNLGGTSTGAATADIQTTEAQKGEVKGDTKKGDGKGDSEISNSEGVSDLHIGIITSSVPQSEDDRRGAEASQAMYGEDMVKLVIYSDNSTEELETTIQATINLPDDPKMKTIIVNQSIPGTTEVFHKIKETCLDILCITGGGHEDLSEIGSMTDLVYNNDFAARSYLIIHTAYEPGCDMSVHISSPRHMAYETVSRRAAVMREACKEFGMEFVFETVPDPISDVGVVGTQMYIPEKVPGWVEKYDKSAVYFCTNGAHIESLLKQLMEYGGYLIETDFPSPLMGYPGVLGIDPTTGAGNFDKIPAKIESTIVERGGADHFGTWVYFYGYTTSAGLVRHALSVFNGEGEPDDIDDITKVYRASPPRTEWSGSSYTNVEAGAKLDNAFLIYQGTYIMGGPGHFIGSTEVEVPEKYFTIK